MKANELMIGDWVEYRFTGWTEKCGVYKDYQYMQISTIGDLYVKADNDRVASADGEDFYPIPLTPEILEKNGWSLMMNGTGKFYLKKPRVDAVIVTKTIIGFQMNHGPFSGLPIHYVHQLQHALRLCEIEKEIEL